MSGLGVVVLSFPMPSPSQCTVRRIGEMVFAVVCVLTALGCLIVGGSSFCERECFLLLSNSMLIGVGGVVVVELWLD